MRACCVALMVLCSVADSGLGQNTSIELLVPAYFYPAGAKARLWQELADAGKSGVPVTAIVNPNSGPGKAVDPNYTQVIARMQQSRVKTIGYLATGYGKRDLKLIEADVAAWLKFYPTIEGFFLDEQASKGGQVKTYMDICRMIRKDRPKAVIVSNPGTVCDPGYFETGGPDVICVFENAETLGKYAPPATFQPPARATAALIHSAAKGVDLGKEVGLAQKHGFGMIFVTDDKMPNPWDTLPSYWGDLVKVVTPPKAAPLNKN
jgi:hypothetical protein